ncbi:thermonuclease family protein [Nostocoides veronense]|uniref:TNase-like domain-containing protein n=1 Tax=Nostocoides veronense TaxID=330836 RepID=A0ABP4XU44_9MICO
MANPPADWYPDPGQANRLRYWDGMQWTTHVVDAPAPSPRRPAPADAARASAYSSSSNHTTNPALTAARKPWSRKRKWVAGGLASVFAIGILGNAFGEDETAKPVAQPVTTTAKPAAPTSTATAAPAPTPSETATSSATTDDGPTMYHVSGVIDGDTIKVRINGTSYRVRILGIDAPELSTRECQAQGAASRMQSLVQSKSVSLRRDPKQPDKDQYGRFIRHVVLADGTYAAQSLLQDGLAREYVPRGSYAKRDDFLAAERSAKKSKLGIWSVACNPAPKPTVAAPLVNPPAPTKPAPSTPRPTTPQPKSNTCNIKGNIARDGEKIYHVPGQRYYDDAEIDPSKGERWFCSESEAVAAGWRKAKV